MLTSLAARPVVSPDGEESVKAELVAFCIVERPDAPPAWVRCGSALVDEDGSVQVRLDAVPLSGELHLRPPTMPTAPAARGLPALRRRAPHPLHS